MRMPQPKPREQGENIIPLINIVFLLLIFFMLAGTLTPPDPFDIEPPLAREGLAADLPEQGVLMLSGDGDIVFEGEVSSLDGLPMLIEARLEEQPDLALTLKADAGVRASQLLDLMDVLRAAGADRILLLTTPDY